MADTPIDAAFAAHVAAPDDEALHLRFLERVMDGELHVLLEAEPEGDRLVPQVFDLAEGRFVLAFDRDARLSEFLDAPAPYAALAGRRLVEMLAGQGIGIGLNLGVAPSETLLPAESVVWMAARMAPPGRVIEARPERVGPPRDVPPDLLAALDAKLAAMAGLIGAAHLITAEFADRGPALLLALVAVPEPAQAEVAAAIDETVRFSGAGAGLDVTFLPADAALLERIAALSIRIDMPAAPEPEAGRPEGSGQRSGPAADPALVAGGPVDAVEQVAAFHDARDVFGDDRG